MLTSFTYHNPTRLHFGKDALQQLANELPQFGPRVRLTYGGGSIKRNGIYDQVVQLLRAANKTIVELPGVMPNPTVEKLRDGAALARTEAVDLILAVGGGSTIDYAKAVAAAAHCDEDPWEKYYLRGEDPSCRVLPVGCVLTMVGTGSEMNGGAVITDHANKRKIGKVFGPELFPKFAILNPEYTYTLPHEQMVAGFFDIMSHIMEQYFSGHDNNTSDYLAEGLMRSLIDASRIAVREPQNYEARSNIMWTATWALNTLLSRGKTGDWQVHMLGHAIGAHTDATHGMTLSGVSIAYYKHVMDGGLDKFVRFARNVWEVPTTDAQGERPARDIALDGLAALEAWMREIGVATEISSLGVTPEMIPSMADATYILRNGYKTLTREEVVEIFTESL